LDLVTIYNCSDLGEATILKSKLEAAGLHPFIQNYEHAQVNVLHLLALGGLNIMVPQSEAEFAIEVISDRTEIFEDTDVFENYEPPKSYQNKKPYRARLLPVILLIVSAILIVIFTRFDVLSFFLVGFALILFHAQNLALKKQEEKQKDLQWPSTEPMTLRISSPKSYAARYPA